MSIFTENLGVIIAIVMFVFFLTGMILSYRKAKRIDDEGITVDGVITRVQIDVNEDGSSSEICYVAYKDENNIERESLAALNSARNHTKGQAVKVKFIPGDYSLVVEAK